MLSARSFQIVTRGVSVALESRKRSKLLDYVTFREVFCTRLSQNSIVYTLTVSVHGWMLQHARNFSDHSEPGLVNLQRRLSIFKAPTHSAQRTPKAQQKEQVGERTTSIVAAQVASPRGRCQVLGLVSIETSESPFEDHGMLTSPGTDRLSLSCLLSHDTPQR